MADLASKTQSAGVGFVGERGHLGLLALKTTLLTLITLGIYRFWARTRIRKFFWSAIRIKDHPFEYNGTGLEKFLGFLIAVAVLAIYLGIIQVLLTFAGMSLFTAVNPEADEIAALLVTYITFAALLPLIYYATYRARRYMLSRTRWRGIRFGMDKAAWGYAGRALVHTFLTIITLGILIPRQTFALEKYKADRTWYGDVKLEQGGKWKRLYPAMKHVLFGVIGMIIGGIVMSQGEFSDAVVNGASINKAATDGIALLGIFIFVLSGLWFYLGFAYYNVTSFRYLTAHKSLGKTVTFTATPKTRKVIGIFIGGGLIASILSSIVAGILVAIVRVALGSLVDPFTMIPVMIAVGYLVFLIVFGVFAMIFIRFPMIKYFAATLEIHNVDALDDVMQREGDDFAEAEGFADALDLGAGI